MRQKQEKTDAGILPHVLFLVLCAAAVVWMKLATRLPLWAAVLIWMALFPAMYWLV